MLRALGDGELLVPERLVIDFPRTRSAGVPAKLECEVASALAIQAILEDIARDWPDVIPNGVDIRGSGLILTGNVGRRLPDVVGVRALMLMGASIWVSTWCDAWLPYDLRGRAQPEIRALNAPRLKAALEEMEKAIGFTAVTGQSRFSLPDGHYLNNPLDIDGEPLDLDLFGYDDSWIVAE